MFLHKALAVFVIWCLAFLALGLASVLIHLFLVSAFLFLVLDMAQRAERTPSLARQGGR